MANVPAPRRGEIWQVDFDPGVGAEIKGRAVWSAVMMGSSGIQPLRFYYGLQPRWFSSDHLYKIYVSESMLAGAFVAGQFHDEQSAAVQFQEAYLLFRPLVRRWLAQRQEREALYDACDPFSSQFLEQDERNFQIQRTDVFRTRLRRNRSLWTAYNVGSLEFEMLDGSVRRFILVGDQQAEAVFDLMKVFDAEIEATGKSRPWQQPKPVTPAQRRRALMILGLLSLALAPLTWYVWLKGGIDDRTAFNAIPISLAGVWCLAMAWRTRTDQ